MGKEEEETLGYMGMRMPVSRRVHEVELERDRAQADFKASLNLIEDLTTSLTEVRQRIWIPLFLLFGQFLDSY